MGNFTPIADLLVRELIALSIILLLLFNSRMEGNSGIVNDLFISKEYAAGN